MKMMRRVVHATPSPLNRLRWCLELDCGHEEWVTSRSRPQRVDQACYLCLNKAGKDAEPLAHVYPFSYEVVLDALVKAKGNVAIVTAALELAMRNNTRPDVAALMPGDE